MEIENESQHYRARFEVYPYSSTDPAFPEVTRAIWAWMQGKEARRRTALGRLLSSDSGKGVFLDGTLSFPDGYRGGMSTTKQTKLAIDSFEPDGAGMSLWALEYDEPDGKLWYRHWHTCVGISFNQEDQQGPCRVNVRVTLYTLPGYFGKVAAPPLANVPNFVKSIIRLEGYQSCVGETVALPEEAYLDGDNFKETFQDNLLSPDRELPLMLMVTDRDGTTPVWDATALAENVMGMANVYVADYRDDDLREQLFSLFKRDTPSINYRCNPGMLRIYQPGIDLDDPYGHRIHRYFLKREVDGYYDEAKKQLGEGASENDIKSQGDSLFADILSRSLARSITKAPDDVLDVADVEAARSRHSMELLRGKYEDLSQRSRVAEKGETPASDESAQRELKEWQQMADEYLRAYEQEAANNNTLRTENSSLESDLSGTRYRAENAEGRAAALSDEVNRLRTQAETIDELDHMPTNLYEELALAARLWPTRIHVLPEAYDSSKEFPGNDLDEQWQILRATANVLWSLYFEEGSADIPGDFRARAGYDLALTEKRQTNRDSSMMRQRDRTYEGRPISITAHIKGRNKNPKFAFRLHYYADEDKKLIVIGHCGGHLTTAGTQKLR